MIVFAQTVKKNPLFMELPYVIAYSMGRIIFEKLIVTQLVKQ
jgi:hypothetical protein